MKSMLTGNKFLDFANEIADRYKGIPGAFDSPYMNYLQEDKPEEEPAVPKPSSITYIDNITNIKEENILYQNNVSFLTTILQKQFYQKFYPTLEERIRTMVQKTIEESSTTIIKEAAQDVEEIVLKEHVQQMEERIITEASKEIEERIIRQSEQLSQENNSRIKAEKVIAEKTIAEKATSEKATSERVKTEKTIAEKSKQLTTIILNKIISGDRDIVDYLKSNPETSHEAAILYRNIINTLPEKMKANLMPEEKVSRPMLVTEAGRPVYKLESVKFVDAGKKRASSIPLNYSLTDSNQTVNNINENNSVNVNNTVSNNVSNSAVTNNYTDNSSTYIDNSKAVDVKALDTKVSKALDTNALDTKSDSVNSDKRILSEQSADNLVAGSNTIQNDYSSTVLPTVFNIYNIGDISRFSITNTAMNNFTNVTDSSGDTFNYSNIYSPIRMTFMEKEELNPEDNEVDSEASNVTNVADVTNVTKEAKSFNNEKALIKAEAAVHDRQVLSSIVLNSIERIVNKETESIISSTENTEQIHKLEVLSSVISKAVETNIVSSLDADIEIDNNFIRNVVTEKVFKTAADKMVIIKNTQGEGDHTVVIQNEDDNIKILGKRIVESRKHSRPEALLDYYTDSKEVNSHYVKAATYKSVNSSVEARTPGATGFTPAKMDYVSVAENNDALEESTNGNSSGNISVTRNDNSTNNITVAGNDIIKGNSTYAIDSAAVSNNVNADKKSVASANAASSANTVADDKINNAAGFTENATASSTANTVASSAANVINNNGNDISSKGSTVFNISNDVNAVNAEIRNIRSELSERKPNVFSPVSFVYSSEEEEEERQLMERVMGELQTELRIGKLKPGSAQESYYTSASGSSASGSSVSGPLVTGTTVAGASGLSSSGANSSVSGSSSLGSLASASTLVNRNEVTNSASESVISSLSEKSNVGAGQLISRSATDSSASISLVFDRDGAEDNGKNVELARTIVGEAENILNQYIPDGAGSKLRLSSQVMAARTVATSELEHVILEYRNGEMDEEAAGARIDAIIGKLGNAYGVATVKAGLTVSDNTSGAGQIVLIPEDSGNILISSLETAVHSGSGQGKKLRRAVYSPATSNYSTNGNNGGGLPYEELIYGEDPAAASKEIEVKTNQLQKQVEDVKKTVRVVKEQTVVKESEITNITESVVHKMLKQELSSEEIINETGDFIRKEVADTLADEMDQNINYLTDKVYQKLEQRLKIERGRRGLS